MNRGSVVHRPRRRTLAASTAALLLGTLLVGLTAAPAGAVLFPNPGAITVPGVGTSGVANPYPSAITVSGLGAVADVNVRLLGISHTFPDDIDVLLVGPTGVKVVLMADTGGANAIAGVNLTLDDAASASLPDATQIFSGTYKPTSIVGFAGIAPAPAGPYATVLSAFNGSSANGAWNLFVYDDTGADTGSIANGWSIDITSTPASITSFTPTSGVPGTSVVITGTSLGAATSVTFGGVLAAFTVNSQTQITATVPPAAVSGPIAVVTPGGTAVSAASFTVVSLEHSRDVSLTVGRKAKGTVSVDDAFAPCASGVPVKVQHRVNGRWRLVGTTDTNATGGFHVPGTRDPGNYRAIALRVVLASNDVCLKATATASH